MEDLYLHLKYTLSSTFALLLSEWKDHMLLEEKNATQVFIELPMQNYMHEVKANWELSFNI